MPLIVSLLETTPNASQPGKYGKSGQASFQTLVQIRQLCADFGRIDRNEPEQRQIPAESAALGQASYESSSRHACHHATAYTALAVSIGDQINQIPPAEVAAGKLNNSGRKLSVVPKAGLEPARPRRRGILNYVDKVHASSRRPVTVRPLSLSSLSITVPRENSLKSM